MLPQLQEECAFQANGICQANEKENNLAYCMVIKITSLLFDQHHILAQAVVPSGQITMLDL